jgi:transposase
MRRRYPSDVTDAGWALPERISFPPGAPRKAGRCETPENLRACLNAIRYLLKTGCQWHILTQDFPHKSTVHEAFTLWTARGLRAQINTALSERDRVAVKNPPMCSDHRQPKREVRRHRSRRRQRV